MCVIYPHTYVILYPPTFFPHFHQDQLQRPAECLRGCLVVDPRSGAPGADDELCRGAREHHAQRGTWLRKLQGGCF